MATSSLFALMTVDLWPPYPWCAASAVVHVSGDGGPAESLIAGAWLCLGCVVVATVAIAVREVMAGASIPSAQGDGSKFGAPESSLRRPRREKNTNEYD